MKATETKENDDCKNYYDLFGMIMTQKDGTTTIITWLIIP